MLLAGHIGTIQRDSQKISVILNRQEYLDRTGLKVMQNVAADVGLINGFQADYNNQVRVNYNISKYVPLSALLRRMTAEQLFGILCNLKDILYEIYNVGFLQYENVSFEEDDIFLDANSYKAYVVYLPIKTGGAHMGQVQFERDFKKAVCRLIQLKATADKKLLGLRKALQSNMSIEEAFRAAHNNEIEVAEEDILSTPPQEEMKWVLTGVGTPREFSLVISGDEYIVGKNPQLAQGVVDFNRTISRRHCKFIQEGGRCFIMDMGSSNGTFVNGQRLQWSEMREVFSGDKIQLASSVFTLEKR